MSDELFVSPSVLFEQPTLPEDVPAVAAGDLPDHEMPAMHYRYADERLFTEPIIPL